MSVKECVKCECVSVKICVDTHCRNLPTPLTSGAALCVGIFCPLNKRRLSVQQTHCSVHPIALHPQQYPTKQKYWPSAIPVPNEPSLVSHRFSVWYVYGDVTTTFFSTTEVKFRYALVGFVTQNPACFQILCLHRANCRYC